MTKVDCKFISRIHNYVNLINRQLVLCRFLYKTGVWVIILTYMWYVEGQGQLPLHPV